MRKVGLSSIIVISITMTVANGLEAGFFAEIPHSFVNGVYTAICNEMCYDVLKNTKTNGYDQRFLTMQKVKDTCNDAVSDGYKMGYCDKNLGTL